MQNLMGLLLFLLMVKPVQAKVAWTYTAFPVVEKNSPLKAKEPLELAVGSQKIKALMSRQSGTHRAWGVEQVYVSADLSKKLFVKYQVQLHSTLPLGGWSRVSRGSVLHLKRGSQVTAYFATGFNNYELYELQKQLQKTESVPQKRRTAWLPWISCAFAEVTSGGAPSPSGAPHARSEAQSASWLARAGGIAQCVGGEAFSQAIDSGKAVWESATLENMGEALSRAPGAAWEGAKSAGRGVVRGLSSAGGFIRQAWSDPEAAWGGVVDGFERTKTVIVQMAQEAEKAIQGFRDLSPEVQDRLVCDMVLELAASGALNAVLAATGAGAAMAAVKITTAVALYGKKISLLMRAISMIDGSELAMADKIERIEELLKNPATHQEQLLPAPVAGLSPASTVLTTAPGDLKFLNSNLRSMPLEEKQNLLQSSAALSNVEKVMAAERVFGRAITPEQARALAQAHDVAPERSFFSYTAADLAQKREILLRAGFSSDEATYLMRRGFAGRMSAASAGPAPTTSTQELLDRARAHAVAGRKESEAENLRLAGERLVTTDLAAAHRSFQAAGEAYVTAYREGTRRGMAPQRLEELREDAITNFIRAGQNQALLDQGLVTSRSVKNQVTALEDSIGSLQQIRVQAQSSAETQAQEMSLLNSFEARRFLIRKFPDQFQRHEAERFEAEYLRLLEDTTRKYGRSWRRGGI